MAKVVRKTKQNPKLVQTEMKDGRGSLALEYYLGRAASPVVDDEGRHVVYTSGAMAGKPKYRISHRRKRQSLSLYIYLKPQTKEERSHNKATLALAEQIRFEREQEFLENREGYRIRRRGENDFLKLFQRHCDNEAYTKPVRMAYKTARRRFLAFLESSPSYIKYLHSLSTEMLSPEMATAFSNYLKTVARGEGAHKSFHMFRSVIRHAIEEGIMKRDPSKGIVMKRDLNTLKKDILTLDEIRRLAATHYEGEDHAVRRAFLFSCFTGMRWCDVSELRFYNIDFETGILRFNQRKTCGRSSHSSVTIPLSALLLKLIGTPGDKSDLSEKIFEIDCFPTTASARLKKWVKKAGIDKKISWHCARHSFAVNLLSRGANIKTVSELMGHSSIRMTEKYLHVFDRQKKEAIESLGDLEISEE